MMNRSGLSSLVGGAPQRGGLAHLARGETVLPSRAMQMDPSLRQHAMSSMARQGRDPMQYTVGARNLRNPSSGLSQFADLIYTENGYVDAATGQAMDFGGGNDFANSGTNYNGAVNYDPTSGSLRVASFAGMPSVRGREIGEVIQFQDMTPEQQAKYSSPVGDFGMTMTEMAQPFRQAREQGIAADPSMSVNPVTGYNPVYGPSGMGFGTPSGGNMNGMQALAPPANAPQQNADSSAPDFGSFSAPQSYDEWRMSRNPGGKGVPNTLFGQTQTAGSDGGVSGQGMQMPNVMAGQMPVPGQQWGTPGTALGFARDNTANDPSILKSGYSDISLSPSVYSGAFGGSGFAPQSGIAFSGQGAGGGYGQQQNPQAAGNFGFGNAFRY